MNEKLKECPFCGGCVIMHKFRLGEIWGIACDKCGAFYSNEWNESKDAVIAAWNRRAGQKGERS